MTEKCTLRNTDGRHINTHVAGILPHKGTYYSYGEIKEEESFTVTSWTPRFYARGVSYYSSKNLKTWQNKGVVFPVNTTDPAHDLHTLKVIERSKVVYN